MYNQQVFALTSLSSSYPIMPLNYLQIALQSFIIGFSIAAPVGPIGILCIRRTLAEGRLAGFVSGLGAATADAFYGAIAAFGLTFISAFLINQSFWLRLIGGIFLLFLGVKTFLTTPSVENSSLSSPDRKNNLLNNYGTTFILTITNPLTILSFAAIFAGFGIGSNISADYLAALIMVAGIFIGSCTWWFILSGFTALFRRTISENSMLWINRISGTIIFIFGVLVLSSFLI